MLAPGEGALELTVAAIAVWGIQESGGRPTHSTTAYAMLLFPESGTVSTEDGGPVSKPCQITWGVNGFVVAGAMIPEMRKGGAGCACYFS